MTITHATVAVGTDAGTGEIHKAQWNEDHTGSNITACKAYHSTTQSINGTATMNFDSEEFDDATYHDNATNNSRLTVPATGKYLFGCSAYGALANNDLEVWFRKNGTTDIRGGALAHGTGNGEQVDFETPISLSASDYIEVRCFTTGATNVGYASTAALQSTFWVARLS
jgi:hypothetical protein